MIISFTFDEAVNIMRAAIYAPRQIATEKRTRFCTHAPMMTELNIVDKFPVFYWEQIRWIKAIDAEPDQRTIRRILQERLIACRLNNESLNLSKLPPWKP